MDAQPAPLKFDPRNPRHWLQVAIFVAALVAAVKGGGTVPPLPDLDAVADKAAEKAVQKALAAPAAAN